MTLQKVLIATMRLQGLHASSSQLDLGYADQPYSLPGSELFEPHSWHPQFTQQVAFLLGAASPFLVDIECCVCCFPTALKGLRVDCKVLNVWQICECLCVKCKPAR